MDHLQDHVGVGRGESGRGRGRGRYRTGQDLKKEKNKMVVFDHVIWLDILILFLFFECLWFVYMYVCWYVYIGVCMRVCMRAEVWETSGLFLGRFPPYTPILRQPPSLPPEPAFFLVRLASSLWGSASLCFGVRVGHAPTLLCVGCGNADSDRATCLRGKCVSQWTQSDSVFWL